MGVKKKDGQYFESRGCNKKYPQLDDLDNVKKVLYESDCPSSAAKTLKVPANSLKHVIDRWLTKEERAAIPWKRLHNKRKDELE